MPSREYSFRFEGLPTPSGEISMRDLVSIGDALQLTATRIARQVGGQAGRGRSTGSIDQMSELRLSGIRPGSTVLEMHLGNVDSLALPGGDEEQVASRFEEILVAVSSNKPPQWANSGVKAAAGKLAAKVSASGATRIIVGRGLAASDEAWQVIDVAELDVAVWAVTEERETDVITVTGRLDKVDLRARRFRVRDDVGNDVTLEDVVDVDAAAQLIGQRVAASGLAEREQGRVVRIIEPVLVREDLPSEWFDESAHDVPAGGVIAAGSITGVTDQEIDEFLAEIRG